MCGSEFELNQVTKIWWRNKRWNLESNCDWNRLYDLSFCYYKSLALFPTFC